MCVRVFENNMVVHEPMSVNCHAQIHTKLPKKVPIGTNTHSYTYTKYSILHKLLAPIYTADSF